jgi:hypothetical protein
VAILAWGGGWILAWAGGWIWGWVWLDPVMGLVGAVLVALCAQSTTQCDWAVHAQQTGFPLRCAQPGDTMNLPFRLATWPLTAFLGMLALGCAAQPRPDCKPAPENVAELVQIRARFHTVQGPLAEFDPCHKLSQLTVPTRWNGSPLAIKPPLLIIAHGGGGLGMLERNLANALQKKDIATLVFDAYHLNGFEQGYRSKKYAP